MQKIKNLVITLLFIFSLLNFAIAKENLQDLIKNAPKAEDYPNASAIYILSEVECKYNNDGTGTERVHKIVKIFTDRGRKAFGEVQIGYSEKMEKIKLKLARTVTKDGKEHKPNKEAINISAPLALMGLSALYTDYKIMTISMPAVEKDCIIEYEYVIEHIKPYIRDNFTETFIFQDFEPILKSRFIVTFPKGKVVNYLLSNFDKKPEIKEDKETKTYIWETNNSEQIIYESYMPSLSWVAPTVKVSTIKTWDDVAKWWYGLIKDKTEPDKDIKEKVAELIKDKNTNLEKIHAIYNYITKNIRYVGIELGIRGYEPQKAVDVFKNKYGDCKDHAMLLISMLKAAGIEGLPVLINAGGKTDRRIPNISFNHAINVVKINNEYLWIDTTPDTYTFGDLPSADQGRDAFVIYLDRGEFVKTPIFEPDKNEVSVYENIYLKDDGGITDEITVKSTGTFQSYLRSMLKGENPEDVKNQIKGFLNFIAPGAVLTDYNFGDFLDNDKQLIVSLKFECPNYASIDEDGIKFRIPSGMVSQYVSMYIGDAFGKEKRQYSVEVNRFSSSWKVRLNTEVFLPQGFKPKVPKGFEAIAPSAKVSANYKEEDGKFISSLEFAMDKCEEITTDEYLQYKKLYNNLMREMKKQFSFIKEMGE